MHPPEDISLEELRARKPKYNKKKASVGQSSAHQQHLHLQQSHAASTVAQMIHTSTASQAHEVCFTHHCVCARKITFE